MPVAIVWIVMHYKHKRRSERSEMVAHNASNAELMAIAARMEKRIQALEEILDAEAPGWRKKHHEHA